MTDDELLALCRSQEYHYDCADCWYSCPKSGQCCNDTAGDECNCGYDRRVKEKMTLYKAGYRAAMEDVIKEWNRLTEIVADYRGYTEDWYDLKKWLDEQVEKGGV